MKVLCFTSVFALTAISALAGASLDLNGSWANPDIVGYAIWQMKDNRTYHRNSNLQPAKQMAGFSIAGLFDVQGRPKKSVETVKRFFNSASRSSSGR